MNARLIRLTLTALVGLQRLYARTHARIPPSLPPSCRSSKKTSLSHHPYPIACHTQFLPDPVIVCRRKLKYPSLSLQASLIPKR